MERLTTIALTLLMLALIGLSIDWGLEARETGRQIASCAHWLTVKAPCAHGECALSATRATDQIRVTVWQTGSGKAALTHTGAFDERLLACTSASPCYGKVRLGRVFGQPQRTLTLDVNGAQPGTVAYYYRPNADRGRFSVNVTTP